MWSLYENENELKPLVFSNGKTQEDVVKEVINAIKQGYKIIFIKGVCGTGKSAIALNIARNIGKTSIVVPIKSLQEQYTNDYTEKKYLLNKNNKLKIRSVFGRQNFKCKFFEENNINLEKNIKKIEKNSTLNEIYPKKKDKIKLDDGSCDNDFLPCKIEIKERNIEFIKEYIKKNPHLRLMDFSSIKEIKRMQIAEVCPYWSPIVQGDFEFKRYKENKKISYLGLNNKIFTIYQRKSGCPYYEQYLDYADADVIIFNSLKYKIETLMDRKPSTELEIIDECDDFLDSFANEEEINLNRLSYSLDSLSNKDIKTKEIIDDFIDTINAIKSSQKYKETNKEEIFELKNSLVEDLLKIILSNSWILDLEDTEETSYLYHLEEVAKTFEDFFEETFFTLEKKENNLIINLVTTNLEKRFKELIEKNKVFVMMSGTIHSEDVLKNIFGISNFKIIEAETEFPGELIKCKIGLELDCSYANFKSNYITREEYLRSLSKCIASAKKPILIHVNSFSDLPNEKEKGFYLLNNIISQEELQKEQFLDPFGKRIYDFKNKKTDCLFTTKCSRGIDFPGDLCNSIILTKFPYPNISSIFWRILKRTKPEHFMSFYIDKARRELLQKIYRGLRSKDDKIYLLSPDIRVLDSEII